MAMSAAMGTWRGEEELEKAHVFRAPTCRQVSCTPLSLPLLRTQITINRSDTGDKSGEINRFFAICDLRYRRDCTRDRDRGEVGLAGYVNYGLIAFLRTKKMKWVRLRAIFLIAQIKKKNCRHKVQNNTYIGGFQECRHFYVKELLDLIALLGHSVFHLLH